MQNNMNYIEDKEYKIIRTIKENNKTVYHYKTNNEIVFLYISENDGNIIDRKEMRTNDNGINPLNGRTQIDGQTKPNPTSNTEVTRKIVRDFVNNIIIPGASNNIERISEYISETTYLQHNVDNNIGDGIEEIIGSINRMKEYGSDLQYDKVLTQVSQNDFSFLISKQEWMNPKTNIVEEWHYYDLFRVEKKKIVEHWDILGRIK